MVFSFKLDAKHLAEILTKAVACCTLHTAAILRDERLNCGGVQRSSKLLLLTLAALCHRHSQQLLVHSCVMIVLCYDVLSNRRGERKYEQS